MKNTSTKFPAEIDDRIFVSDISIDQVPVMKNYYMYLNAGNYTMASELLNNSEVFFYGAWLLNLLENRLHAIGEYLMSLGETKQLTTYNNSLPDNAYQGMNWVGDGYQMEFQDDFVDTDVNYYLHGNSNTASSVYLDDTWITDGTGNLEYVGHTPILYSDTEPSNASKNNIWIGE